MVFESQTLNKLASIRQFEFKVVAHTVNFDSLATVTGRIGIVSPEPLAADV
jgi:hypothetical protein